jgi:hypothetical protein
MKKLITLVIVIMAAGILTYQMLNLARVECDLCIEFKGKRRCTTAFGATHEQALDEAHRTACALVASGVTEVLACQRLNRQNIACRPPL